MNIQTIGKGMMVASTVGIAASYALLPSDDDTRNTLLALFGRAILLGSLPTKIHDLRNAFQHRDVAPIRNMGYQAAIFLLPTIYFAFSPQSPIPSGESLEAYAKLVTLAVSFTTFNSSPTVPPPIFVHDEHEGYEPPPPNPLDPDRALGIRSREKLQAFCRLVNFQPDVMAPDDQRFFSDSEELLKQNTGNPEFMRGRLGEMIDRLQMGTTANDIPEALQSLREQLSIAEQFLKGLEKADRQILANNSQFIQEAFGSFISTICGFLGLARLTKFQEQGGEIEYSVAYYNAKDQERNFASLAQASHHLLVSLFAFDQVQEASFVAEKLVDIAQKKPIPEKNNGSTIICDAAHVITGLYDENPLRTLREHFDPKDRNKAGDAFNEFLIVAQTAAKEARKLADDFDEERDPNVKETMDTIATFSEWLVKYAETLGDKGGGLAKSSNKGLPADAALAETGTGDKEGKKEA